MDTSRPPTSPPRRVRRRATHVAGVAALVSVILAGCAAPELTAIETPTASTSPRIGASPADGRDAAVATELAQLRTTVTAAKDHLDRARAAEAASDATDALEAAVHALTADPRLAADLDGDGEIADPGTLPLLPGAADELGEDESYDVVFTRLLTAARDAGTAGGAAIDLLRDPVAGDIGTWQGDADAIIDAVEAASRARTLDDAQAAIGDLPGEATKSLAWARWALRQRDTDVRRTGADRAAAHLDLILSLVTATP